MILAGYSWLLYVFYASLSVENTIDRVIWVSINWPVPGVAGEAKGSHDAWCLDISRAQKPRSSWHFDEHDERKICGILFSEFCGSNLTDSMNNGQICQQRHSNQQRKYLMVDEVHRPVTTHKAVIASILRLRPTYSNK